MDRASAFNQTSDNIQNDNIPLGFEEDDLHVAQSSVSRLLLSHFRNPDPDISIGLGWRVLVFS